MATKDVALPRSTAVEEVREQTPEHGGVEIDAPVAQNPFEFFVYEGAAVTISLSCSRISKADLACQLLQSMSHDVRSGCFGELSSRFVRNTPHELHGGNALSPVHRLCGSKSGLLYQLIARHPVDEYRVRKELVGRTETVPPTHIFK